MGQKHISVSGDTGRISLPNRFDVMSTAALRIPFVRLLADAQAQKLVVDFSLLEYIDSMGIGTLMSWKKTCDDHGKTLVLDKCSARIVSMLRLSGVERLFVFAPDAA